MAIDRIEPAIDALISACRGTVDERGKGRSTRCPEG